MSYKYNYNKNPNLIQISCSITKSIDDELRDISAQLRIPKSTLILRAIQNELASENRFKKTIYTDMVYDEGLHSDQAVLLSVFIKNNPAFGLEHLLLFKSIIGIESDDILIACLEMLVNEGTVTAHYPNNRYFTHPKGYRVYYYGKLSFKTKNKQY